VSPYSAARLGNPSDVKVLVTVAVHLCSLPWPVQQTQGALRMLGTLYQDTHNVMLLTTVSVCRAAAKATRCCLPLLACLAGGKMSQWEAAVRLESCLPVTYRNIIHHPRHR